MRIWKKMGENEVEWARKTNLITLEQEHKSTKFTNWLQRRHLQNSQTNRCTHTNRSICSAEASEEMRGMGVKEVFQYKRFWNRYDFSCKLYCTLLLQVTLVGLIRSVKESTTRIDYELDDMTGPPLEVKQFVDNDVSAFLLMYFEIMDVLFIFCDSHERNANIYIWFNDRNVYIYIYVFNL